jgi:ribosomal-protein-alanine N-acetyltransferase
MTVETSRLSLRPCAPQQLVALIDHPDGFERVVGLRAADGLREFFVSGEASPDWLAAVRRSAGPDPWRHGFFVIDPRAQTVIGTAGFTGPPDATGTVEIAYGIVPGEQGRGYATEVAAALIAFAGADARVHLVRAHTRPERNASTRVLEKCGFRHVGTVVDPHDGPVWRWERGVAGSTGDLAASPAGA